MKAVFINVLLGTTLLLAPFLILHVSQHGLRIPGFVRTEPGKTLQSFEAVPMVDGDNTDNTDNTDSNMFSCDDFGLCPEGWSLVASPSLVLCHGKCAQELCCSADQAAEVVQVIDGKAKLNMEEMERRLGVNDNMTTMTATTTTTEYSATMQTWSNDTNTTLSTATTTGTTTTADQGTTATTQTSTITGTTTASSASPTEETVITFEMFITLTDGQLQNFLVSEQIKESFEESMAERLNIPKSWVHAQLAATRRLAEGSAHLRRLASVTVSFTITIPAPANLPATGLGSAVTLAAVQSGISSTDTAALTTAIDGKLAAKGLASTFSVTVDSIGTITVDVRTFTTTSTMTNPVVEDDSFAFTKVAFTPAHVFALLAMGLTAMSS
mmetsp:Transcript_77591/g.157559  ORF Transcript_77591/g.157559 Transcript_77591/m.157559 type:complete len:383 (-) Transcript_77591:383-1531(-)